MVAFGENIPKSFIFLYSSSKSGANKYVKPSPPIAKNSNPSKQTLPFIFKNIPV